MSNQTPDEYLNKNPDSLVYRLTGYDYRSRAIAATKQIEANVDLDWTGYTEPHILAGPGVPWSRKKGIEWSDWNLGKTEHDDDRNDPLYKEVRLDAEYVAFQIGRYIDAPEEKPDRISTEIISDPIKFAGNRECVHCGKRFPICDIDHHELFCDQNLEQAAREMELEKAVNPELSRFLPEGWVWRYDKDFGWGAYSGDTPKVMMCDSLGAWHYFNLLHPSEGGGFQQHTPGDPMPCDGDLIIDWCNQDCTHRGENYRARDMNWMSGNSYAWRPHYPQKQEVKS